MIVFTLRNGFKLLYLVKFMSIENSYGLEPLIVDKKRTGSNMVNFSFKNKESEEIEFTVSDVSVARNTVPVSFYHPHMLTDTDEMDNKCDNKITNVSCYEQVS